LREGDDMISLRNSTAQTLTAGQNLTFDTVIFHTGNGECFRKGTGSVKMCSHGVYVVSFNANIASSTAGDVLQLSIQTGGETVTGSAMISSPSAVDNYNEVSVNIPISNCCCDYDRITITNTGTTTVTVAANAQLFVRRVA